MMFIGWIAFFTRGVTARHGLINLACVLAGLAIGMLAGAAGAALVVLSLGLLPEFNNLFGFFPAWSATALRICRRRRRPSPSSSGRPGCGSTAASNTRC